MMKKVLVIAGPTASGKTSRAIELAKELNGEIVSADSRQIYRGMDIGTAKPRGDSGIRHHLIDIRNIEEPYTAADFQADAFAAIDDILSRGKMPILSGGTGLYIRAVMENLIFPPTSFESKRESSAEELIRLDPEAEKTVDMKNPRRVARALEATLVSGKPWSRQQKKNPPRYAFDVEFLNPLPEVLRERINKRVEEMFSTGLVEEVRGLLSDKASSPSILLDTIGYKEIIDYLRGSSSLEESKAQIKLNTWHYAKRQITWFKKYLPGEKGKF